MKKYFIARSKNLAFCLRQNVNLFIVLLFLFLFLYPIPYTLYPTFAVESTQSATPSSNIKAKLEELKKEIASKAAKLKQEVNRKLKDKAYVGVIKTKTDSTLTLAAKSGAKIITINQDTIFESKLKSKKKLTLKNLSEEDFVAALGDIDETGVLTAKKIILLPPPKSSKTILWGQIISISDRLSTLKDRNLKNIAIILPSSKAALNDFAILTGFFGKNDIFEADFVHIIPQGGVLKPKKMATPSATPKSTTSSRKKK